MYTSVKVWEWHHTMKEPYAKANKQSQEDISVFCYFENNKRGTYAANRKYVFK